MKHIILGDIHGRTIWKDILAKEWDENVKIVFIGDYLDTHENTTGEQQLSNLLDIIAFKDANPDNCILLFGNHDYHYLDVNEGYSGYQQGWSYQFREVLYNNLNKFQMCYQIPDTNIVCSHAGISKTWLLNNGFCGNKAEIEQFINDLFTYKPLSFRFTGNDDCGDDVRSSPIWIRPRSLAEDAIEGFIQIVGHTVQKAIIEPKEDSPGYFIDTLGTSKEYLSIENGIISICKI